MSVVGVTSCKAVVCVCVCVCVPACVCVCVHEHVCVLYTRWVVHKVVGTGAVTFVVDRPNPDQLVRTTCSYKVSIVTEAKSSYITVMSIL